LGIVLITLNECPLKVESGFFVGQADLKREALIGKKKLDGVIETSCIICHCELAGSNLK